MGQRSRPLGRPLHLACPRRSPGMVVLPLPDETACLHRHDHRMGDRRRGGRCERRVRDSRRGPHVAAPVSCTRTYDGVGRQGRQRHGGGRRRPCRRFRRRAACASHRHCTPGHQCPWRRPPVAPPGSDARLHRRRPRRRRRRPAGQGGRRRHDLGRGTDLRPDARSAVGPYGRRRPHRGLPGVRHRGKPGGMAQRHGADRHSVADHRSPLRRGRHAQPDCPPGLQGLRRSAVSGNCDSDDSRHHSRWPDGEDDRRRRRVDRSNNWSCGSPVRCPSVSIGTQCAQRTPQGIGRARPEASCWSSPE